jgi:hypothetical protein
LPSYPSYSGSSFSLLIEAKLVQIYKAPTCHAIFPNPVVLLEPSIVAKVGATFHGADLAMPLRCVLGCPFTDKSAAIDTSIFLPF